MSQGGQELRSCPPPALALNFLSHNINALATLYWRLPRLKHKSVKKIGEKEEQEKRKSGTSKRNNQALINLKKMG
jgi:hypothetical protein